MRTIVTSAADGGGGSVCRLKDLQSGQFMNNAGGSHVEHPTVAAIVLR